jgi:hypothetical protein
VTFTNNYFATLFNRGGFFFGGIMDYSYIRKQDNYLRALNSGMFGNITPSYLGSGKKIKKLLTGLKMEIETRDSTIMVGNLDADNEIEINFDDAWDWISIDNAKQLISHLQEQVDKHGKV